MLDQNTDRMWYVIGAVIVGASLIFLMNSTFPGLFGTIGETFEGKVDDVTQVVEDTTMTDGIRPVVPPKTDGINRLSYGHKEMTGGYIMYPNGHTVATGGKPEYLRHEDLSPIIRELGVDTTYTLTFEAKSLDASEFDRLQVYLQSGAGSEYTMPIRYVSVTEEYKTYTITGVAVIKNASNAALETPYTTSHLSFYGKYETGNVPVVRNIRLEKEVK